MYSCTLYINSSSNNTAAKDIEAIADATFTVDSLHSVNVLAPDIVTDFNSALLAANYVYIGLFNRYYYCTIETDTAERMIIHCKVDALTTAWYKHDLAGKQCSVIRSESTGATDIPDKSFPVNPSKIFYQGIVLPGNDLSANLYPYVISVNSSYS